MVAYNLFVKFVIECLQNSMQKTFNDFLKYLAKVCGKAANYQFSYFLSFIAVNLSFWMNNKNVGITLCLKQNKTGTARFQDCCKA